MTRIARAVAVDVPYHVTHRGIRGADIFFDADDRRRYLDDLAGRAVDGGLDIWGWCLMTNHIHLLVVPRRRDALARVIGRAHQRHSQRINAAHGWRGHLWADRFYSTPLDDLHLWTAIKYIELNPLRAGLVRRAEEWSWSSARHHSGVPARDWPGELPATGSPFGGTRPHPLDGRPMAWADWLSLGLEAEAIDRLRRATMTGRPCGSESFAQGLEAQLGRVLTPQKRGPKSTAPNQQPNEENLFQ
ncbi:MAG: transposase [Candidatus Sumerlaeia bacterium]